MLKKLKNKLKDQRGLTLIELLAVIVIIGIVAAIAVLSIGKVIDNSRIEAVKADATQILNAAKLYVAENGLPAETAGVATVPNTGIEEYLESVTTFEMSGTKAFKVVVKDNTFYIDGVGDKSGVTVDFDYATLSHISGAVKGDDSIGSGEPTAKPADPVDPATTETPTNP